MCAYKLILVIAVLACPSWAFRAPNLESRIIGGTEADIKDFPYMAALLDGGTQFGGASLIASNVAVTAAHCLSDISVGNLTLRVGSSRWDSGGQEISVKEFFKHENFFDSYADVGVIILSKNVQNAITIPLAPADRQYSHGTLGVVLGWGLTSFDDNNRGSDVLMKLEVPIVEASICKLSYYDITPKHICAGNMKGGKHFINGDSGGPLVINGELVGIVCYTGAYTSPKKPDVYTFVPPFHNWIEKYANI